jgi:predicted HTH transcriptional regulator
MKTETHNIEFKQTWKDEYLEWICGYANAAGGVLYIGRDDDGTAVGVAKAKSLMESIPCKIIAGCKEYGGQRPNYKISESGVMVLCRACPKYVELQNSGAGTLEETGRKKRVDGLMKTTPETTPETTTETAQEKIRDSLCRIIAVIKSRPDATMTEIAAETGLSRDGVKWNLSKLKELKKIRRIGYTKGGHWEVL